MKRTLSTAARSAALCGLVASACSGSVETPPPADLACAREADCAAELTCRAGQCQPQCQASEDCDIGWRCLALETEHLCVLPAELACAFDDDCREPLRCAPDGNCRSVCDGNADCIKSELCAEQGFCAREDELDTQNRLPEELPVAPAD